MRSLKYIPSALICILTVGFALWVNAVKKKTEEVIFTLESRLQDCQLQNINDSLAVRVAFETTYTALPPKYSGPDEAHTLFLRIHSDMCPTCFVNDLKTFVRQTDSLPLNVHILGSYESENGLKSICRSYGLGNFISINHPELHNRIPADRTNAPYLFILSKHNQIEHVFFLSRQEGSPEAMNSYLHMILRKIHSEP